jgi:integrase
VANKPGKRQFGSVRQLPSGRFQARYVTPDGEIVTAPTTFAAKGDAGRFLDAVRTDLERGNWVDPSAGRISLEAFAGRWLHERPLRPRTKELYEGLLDLHVLPVLGKIELNRITPAKVCSWHAELLRGSYPGLSTTAKAYRLLRAILNTAVEDGRIAANPCQIEGAGRERPEERPVATVAEVYALADAVGAEHRLLVLLACFAGLRLGELQALRRRHVDLDRAAIRIVEQTLVLRDGTHLTGPPKTDAGIRVIALPESVVDELRKHLVAVPDEPDALVLGRPGNRPFRRATLYTAWHAATKRLGMDGFRIHDLRHTGNTLAAATGASTKELMARMGHASPRAALIYQHATSDRDVVIAKALDGMIRDVLDREWHANGTTTESSADDDGVKACPHTD